MRTDMSLYLVTARYGENDEEFLEKIEEACKNGVSMVQFREKEITTFAYYELANKVKKVTDRYQIPLIINDRVDICLAVDAAGVHIGDDELPTGVTRSLIGNKILGRSVKSVLQAKEEQKNGADYLGVGAVFPTETKEKAHSTSLKTLKQMTQQVTIPIVAIGGITEERLKLFDHIGIDGVAVVSEIMKASDIGTKVRRMKEGFDQLEGK